MQTEQEQKALLASCVHRVPIKRRYGDKNLDSRRKCSKQYFLPIQRQRTQVCQQFLLATLSISQKKIRYIDEHKTEMDTPKPGGRGHKEPKNKTAPEVKQYVENFVKMLPAVPSHYCRGGTTKRYLPVEFRNIANLYRIYKQHCNENNKKFITEKLFRRIFNSEFNIGFHLPKKDKCLICEGEKNKTGDTQSNSIEKHLIEKEQSKIIHLRDQQRAKEDPSFVSASFDLQKVLNTPHGNNMLLYYSRKYSYYNETIYESGTRNVYCYMWGEQDGKRGANEICTILCDYLEIVDNRQNIKEVSLFCDSCPGQNKNRQILSSIVWFLRSVAKNIDSISITYLLPGHTYMPVDSVHATIENKVRRTIIWAPSEWPTVIRNARNNLPYNVTKMTFDRFRNFKSMQVSIFPDNIKKTDSGKALQFQKIRKVSFLKGSDRIKLHYSFVDGEDEEMLSLCKQPSSRSQMTTRPPQLYNELLPVSVAKIKDLMSLVKKSIIPDIYKEEYMALKAAEDIPDVLAETDEEDTVYEQIAIDEVPSGAKKKENKYC